MGADRGNALTVSRLDARRALLLSVLWLTRIAGGVVLLGLGTFVPAWRARSVGLVVIGAVVILVGAVMMSLRLMEAVGTEHQWLQYRLLKWPSKR